MSPAERNTLDDTLAHIRRVQEYLHKVVSRLLRRGAEHDKTKLEEPEFSEFARVSGQLEETTYGSEEYEALLEELRAGALEHHYAHNDHHPEHERGGLEDMTLLSITEMLCDWKAASERHDDGNIFRSIEQNQERFGYSDEVKSILRNTAEDLFPNEPTPTT